MSTNNLNTEAEPERKPFEPGDIVVHLKTGRKYEIIVMATDVDTLGRVVVYRSEHHTWTRKQSEFEDGRFVHVAP